MNNNTIHSLFWSNVTIVNSCWNWTGTLDQHGTPIIRVDSNGYYPRRISLELSGRQVYDRVQTTCKNKLCVNPKHLISGNEDRFWNYVDTSNECWIWTAGKGKNGYGKFAYVNSDGKKITTGAHRYSYELSKGRIPKDMSVCHHCDNPPCVNPKHLFLGTTKDNVHDCMRKGRFPRGEKSGSSILTNAQALEIKEKCNILSLSEEYGISPRTIMDIVTGVTWHCLEEGED